MAVSFKSFKGRANTSSVKIEGLAALNKSFDKLALKSDSFLNNQIHIALSSIAERANRDVPVDTGRLLKSIKVTRTRQGGDVEAREGYAGFVEGGTKFMRAQPYFFKHVEPALKMLSINMKNWITL